MKTGFGSTPAARRIRAVHSLSRNPLVVQFWLLGLDAARGTLLARGFQKSASPVGSSVYTCGALSLHSKGLWIETATGPVHYLRPRETFYRLPPHADMLARNFRPPEGTCYLSRAEGLALVRPYVLTHEAWITQKCGLQARSYAPPSISVRPGTPPGRPPIPGTRFSSCSLCSN